MQQFSPYQLSPDQVRFSIDEQEIITLQNGHQPQKIIGQPRAVEALRLAIAIQAKGYNVYAAGYSGTGKRTAIMRILKEQPFLSERLRDIAYVNNFNQPDRPRVLYFTRGHAMKFKKKIQQLLEDLKEQMRRVFEQGSFREKRDSIMITAEGHENQALVDFEKKLKVEGFVIIQIREEDDQRADIAPLLNGETSSFDDLQRLVTAGELAESQWNSIRERYYQLMDEMNQIFSSRTNIAQLNIRVGKLTAQGCIRFMCFQTP